MLTVDTPAKINLSLEVIGKRPDGYHDLVSVMQAVTLTDQLGVSLSANVRLECDDASLESTDNLVLQAAQLLRSKFHVSAGCTLRLSKRIPVSAGLGGGSSDAAAALVALNRLWSLRLTCPDLLSLAGELGSDVPFFLFGNRALVEGRGERVTPIESGDACWYLLSKPHISVSTADVFANLTSQSWTDGVVTKALARRNGIAGSRGINGLQATLFSLHPGAQTCFELAEIEAPGLTIVSGSGPTVVSIFPSRETARAAQIKLAAHGYWTEICTTVARKDWTTPCIAA